MKKASLLVVNLAPVAAFAAFFLETAGFIVLGLFKPGYNPVRSTISELGERGGINAGVAAGLFILLGFLEIVFALGLYLRLRPSKTALTGSLFLMINGISDCIGSGIFPCDAGGLYQSFSGQMHFLVSVVGMSVMILPAFFFWAAFRGKGMKREALISLVGALAIVAGAVLFNVAFFTEAAWLGLAQRVLGFLYWGWMAILAWGMVSSGRFS